MSPFRCSSQSLLLGLGLCAASLMLPAQAQPAQAEPAQTLKRPSTDGKVLGGVKRGTDAAGRGIDKAGDATLRGVNRASESAARPVRNVGESFGRKLEQGPGGGRSRARTTTGPQGDGP